MRLPRRSVVSVHSVSCTGAEVCCDGECCCHEREGGGNGLAGKEGGGGVGETGVDMGYA